MTFPVLGITGLPCSGKSFAAALLASGEITGVPGELFKADDVGHEVLLRPEVAERLRGHFGADIFADADPAAIRRAIAGRVFGDAEALRWLEGVVHPLVLAETDAAITAAKERGRPLVMEAALLFESGMELRCDRVLLIESDFEVRLRRAAGRGWDRGELERRERRQTPLFEAARRGPDSAKIFVVDNNGDARGLKANLRNALQNVIQREK